MNDSKNTNAMTTAKGAQPPAQAPAQTPQVVQENMSERFTKKVLAEFGSSVSGAMEVTDFQRRLIQGYFIMIDRALKTAEEERIRKNNSNSNHDYDNPLPVTWQSVNLGDLALDLVHYARMGLDMQQDAMLYPIPYKNNKRNCYDITLMEGYNGIKYTALRYALERPIGETVELVYSTDTFVPHMRDSAHPAATYEFQINNAFDRGEIVGGFGYLEFADPSKNELIIMPLKAILKRKPEYASANFWGGKSSEWQTVDGKRKKVEVEKEGWFEEMCRKTLIREVYSAKHLPRDPQKIDDAYQYMKAREARYAEIQAQAEIDAQANTIPIDTAPQPDLEPDARYTASRNRSSRSTTALPAAPAEPITIPQANPATGEVIGTNRQAPAQASLYDTPDF